MSGNPENEFPSFDSCRKAALRIENVPRVLKILKIY